MQEGWRISVETERGRRRGEEPYSRDSRTATTRGIACDAHGIDTAGSRRDRPKDTNLLVHADERAQALEGGAAEPFYFQQVLDGVKPT